MARIIVALAATALLVAPGGAAATERCVIVGGPQAPVEVRIYESDPYRAPAGKRLFIGLLNFGERHRIKNRDGRIWYAFRYHEGDTWRDDTKRRAAAASGWSFHDDTQGRRLACVLGGTPLILNPLMLSRAGRARCGSSPTIAISWNDVGCGGWPTP